MFKWPNIPFPQASLHELADYAELLCWKEGGTSVTALSRALGRIAENEYSGGVPEDDAVLDKAEQTYEELERRQEVCREGYPFAIGSGGITLQLSKASNDIRHDVYKYLLLATRLNMNDSRYHAGIDGTLLFEELAAEIARGYFGNRAKSLVFGTAADDPNFEAKVNTLCAQLGEGVGFVGSDSTDSDVKDGKLDVVVWKPFADKLDGQLIGFGQCKTGTNYKHFLQSLQPEGFCRKWLLRPPAVLPVRMFFIAEALSMSTGYRRNMSIDSGLLFDRCRIIDYCSEVDETIMLSLRSWMEAASASEIID